MSNQIAATTSVAQSNLFVDLKMRFDNLIDSKDDNFLALAGGVPTVVRVNGSDYILRTNLTPARAKWCQENARALAKAVVKTNKYMVTAALRLIAIGAVGKGIYDVAKGHEGSWKWFMGGVASEALQRLITRLGPEVEPELFNAYSDILEKCFEKKSPTSKANDIRRVAIEPLFSPSYAVSAEAMAAARPSALGLFARDAGEVVEQVILPAVVIGGLVFGAVKAIETGDTSAMQRAWAMVR